jgi:DNA polymerase-4
MAAGGGVSTPAYCRACGHRQGQVHGRESEAPVCPACGATARAAHPEIDALAIAHLDCDAFYAAIEKRDDPRLAPVPVIIGGGRRGVVATACYIARAYGVRSAMPMFKALKLCPDAVVVRPNMAKYIAVGQAIRARMQALTPLVEPLSIDEAFMDLTGTEALHGGAPARTLIGLQNAIEAEFAITVSIGLSFNKFLAKFASDMDKPRGFSVIGRADALDVIAAAPAGRLPGVGPAAAKALEAAGWRTIGDVRRAGDAALSQRFGDWGRRLFSLANAQDERRVDPDSDRKTLSAETTFNEDVSAVEQLADLLWPLCEKVSDRARAADLAGRTITLKLKTARFKSLTRRRTLSAPTKLAARLFEAGRALLEAEADGRTAYRLIGIGLSDFADASDADHGDLMDARTPKRAAAEDAIAKARAKFGKGAVITGRGLKSKRD